MSIPARRGRVGDSEGRQGSGCAEYLPAAVGFRGARFLNLDQADADASPDAVAGGR